MQSAKYCSPRTCQTQTCPCDCKSKRLSLKLLSPESSGGVYPWKPIPQRSLHTVLELISVWRPVAIDCRKLLTLAHCESQHAPTPVFHWLSRCCSQLLSLCYNTIVDCVIFSSFISRLNGQVATCHITMEVIEIPKFSDLEWRPFGSYSS